MDMKEASAMTEASGLTNAQGDIERTPEVRRDSVSGRQPLQPSSDAAMRWAEQLREVTMKAPLQSLCVAFLVGAWVGRRL
ncbi:hypothetical protein H8A99_14070 [Bradyrhizobium sp. Arg68]|uniref:hypothetical protein n=1 Tax=Bradyrhizobium ivorense TaxID=2511166 RepID=UPI001E39C154|nr:hypothetical protein [Bradyrhizobium ivorense]MCC8937568.1 hypothetical protein [Bradyrhizobium ivorense]